MILSVSRRTDIPNYYSDWFLDRIKAGFLYVRNPMNAHQISKIDLSKNLVDCIVFWTKNPENMIEKLDDLKNYTYYFQFTLTGYGREIEPNLPDKKSKLIPTFQQLSQKIGKEKVIWRYDPIFVSQKYTIAYHLKAFEEIAKNLADYTDKVIISFIDPYTKTKRNTKEVGIESLTMEAMLHLAKNLALIASKYNLSIETCAEQIDLKTAGIPHGSCIDKKLIERILNCKLTGKKDKNQREICGCLESIDIGTYNTCRNGCNYCYANFSEDKVKENIKLYNQNSPLLCGNITSDDKITDRKVKSLKY